MKKYVLLILLVCCFMFSLTGCTKEDDFIGEWKLVGVIKDGKQISLKSYLEERYYDEGYENHYDSIDEYIKEYQEDHKLEILDKGRALFCYDTLEWTIDGNNICLDYGDEYLDGVLEDDQLILEWYVGFDYVFEKK